MINMWLKGLTHSLAGGALCTAYIGDIILFVKMISTTGNEAVSAFFYFVFCVLITILGPVALVLLEEEE